MAVPVHKRSTGLRFQATNLRCFPSGDGYALSSVDGRVSMEYYEDSASAQEQKFAFKCHRIKDKVAGEDVVYPVTGLEFHPQYKRYHAASVGKIAAGGGKILIRNLTDADCKPKS
ncbi:hypothetical protein OXX80_006554 [Metschnikowia pulcherrima]